MKKSYFFLQISCTSERDLYAVQVALSEIEQKTETNSRSNRTLDLETVCMLSMPLLENSNEVRNGQQHAGLPGGAEEWPEIYRSPWGG